MTSTDLVPYCHSALDRTSVSRGVHRLRTEGLIEAAEERQSHEGRGARPIKAYRITPEGEAALNHLPAGQVGLPAGQAGLPTCLPDRQAGQAGVQDVATGQAGLPGAMDEAPDEEREAAYAELTHVPVLDDDAVIMELQAIKPRPAIPHAGAHAERLRTLAERLRMLDARTTLTQTWLYELADLLDPECAP